MKNPGQSKETATRAFRKLLTLALLVPLPLSWSAVKEGSSDQGRSPKNNAQISTSEERVATAAGSAQYAYQSQFGRTGTGNGEFSLPSGIAIDPTSHNIVVTDSLNDRVQIFTSTGTYLSQFGTRGTGNGQFRNPQGIAIDPTSHNIVVGDEFTPRIQIFSSTGIYLSQFGTTGTGNGEFRSPNATYGIAIDPGSHNIVVADCKNTRVQIFSSTGTYLTQFGTLGRDNGQFSYAQAIAIDPTSHNFVVADFGGNGRAQVFASTGTYLNQFGAVGHGSGQFSDFSSFAIDASNHNLIVADHDNARVQIFSPSGSNYTYHSQFGQPGRGNGQFNRPKGIADDPASHNVVVADSSNDRIQIFKPMVQPTQ